MEELAFARSNDGPTLVSLRPLQPKSTYLQDLEVAVDLAKVHYDSTRALTLGKTELNGPEHRRSSDAFYRYEGARSRLRSARIAVEAGKVLWPDLEVITLADVTSGRLWEIPERLVRMAQEEAGIDPYAFSDENALDDLTDAAIIEVLKTRVFDCNELEFRELVSGGIDCEPTYKEYK